MHCVSRIKVVNVQAADNRVLIFECTLKWL